MWPSNTIVHKVLRGPSVNSLPSQGKLSKYMDMENNKVENNKQPLQSKSGLALQL